MLSKQTQKNSQMRHPLNVQRMIFLLDFTAYLIVAYKFFAEMRILYSPVTLKTTEKAVLSRSLLL